MQGNRPVVSLRRTVQQIVHCAKEALAVVEAHEDCGNAVGDLEQAQQLIQVVLPLLRTAHELKKGGG
jgi:hypothetical protein